jgi:hypothetical protein
MDFQIAGSAGEGEAGVGDEDEEDPTWVVRYDCVSLGSEPLLTMTMQMHYRDSYRPDNGPKTEAGRYGSPPVCFTLCVSHVLTGRIVSRTEMYLLRIPVRRIITKKQYVLLCARCEGLADIFHQPRFEQEPAPHRRHPDSESHRQPHLCCRAFANGTIHMGIQ